MSLYSLYFFQVYPFYRRLKVQRNQWSLTKWTERRFRWDLDPST